jgi:hypothetical protein
VAAPFVSVLIFLARRAHTTTGAATECRPYNLICRRRDVDVGLHFLTFGLIASVNTRPTVLLGGSILNNVASVGAISDGLLGFA